jgi:hypothetical protein
LDNPLGSGLSVLQTKEYSLKSTMRVLLGVLAMSVGCYAQTCTQTFNSGNVGSSPYPGSSVNTAVKGGTSSTVLCFSSGSYGTIDIYGAHPSGSGQVTLMPAPGATVTGISFNLNGVSNVLITGFQSPSSLDGGVLIQVAGQGNNSNITITHNDMPTTGVNVSNNALANAAILIDSNTFVGYASSPEESRINIVSNNSCPNGITISNNLISGGEADGIDISGNSCQTQILNNTITNIIESNCGGIHCDAIQDNGGGNGTHIKGNLIYNTSDCFLFDDGTSNYLIEDNVCGPSLDSSYWMQFGGAATITLNHNTVVSTANAQYGNDHNGNPSSNVTFTNNIFYSVPTQNSGQPVSGTFTSDYNLCTSGCAGTHSVTGTPHFVGGTSPTTYAGFALTSSSLGVNAGSDGNSIGIIVGAQSPPPVQPPTLLGDVVH